MSDDGAPRDVADVIARLKEFADESGAVTYAQINDALGPLDVASSDIEALLSEIERSGLHCTDEDAGPPVIPTDFSGLKIVRTVPG